MLQYLFCIRHPFQPSSKELAIPTLTEKYEEAFLYAARTHRDDLRKGTDIPYLTHLMSVSALVLEDGGSEEEAIAGLLHDAVEDHGEERLREIREQFGARVAGIVEACSDSIVPEGEEKPDWQTRKTAYIDRVRDATDLGYLRVTLADKLHNARCILSDLRTIGLAVFERFNPEADTLWYYRSLVEAFTSQQQRGLASPMLGELDRVVTDIEGLAATGP